MKSDKGCVICKVVGVLVGLGALNWGLVTFWGLNLVDKALGMGSAPAKVAYGAIGIAGALKLFSLVQACPCQKKS